MSGSGNRRGEYKTWHLTGVLTPTPEITRIFSCYAHESQYADKTRGPIMAVRNWMEKMILNEKPDCITFMTLRFSSMDNATGNGTRPIFSCVTWKAIFYQNFFILKTIMYHDSTTVLNERKHLKIVIRSVPDSISLFLDQTNRPGLTTLHSAIQQMLNWRSRCLECSCHHLCCYMEFKRVGSIPFTGSPLRRIRSIEFRNCPASSTQMDSTCYMEPCWQHAVPKQ